MEFIFTALTGRVTSQSHRNDGHHAARSIFDSVNRFAGLAARVGNTDQLYAGKLGIFGGMVTAKSADPDHAGSQYARGCLNTLEQGNPRLIPASKGHRAGVRGDS